MSEQNSQLWGDPNGWKVVQAAAEDVLPRGWYVNEQGFDGTHPLLAVMTERHERVAHVGSEVAWIRGETLKRYQAGDPLFDGEHVYSRTEPLAVWMHRALTHAARHLELVS